MAKKLTLTNSIGGPKLVNFVTPDNKNDIIFRETNQGVYATRMDGSVLYKFNQTSLTEIEAEILLIVKDWKSNGDERLQQLQDVELEVSAA